MFCLLVRGRRVGGAIGLDQHKASWIVLLLNNVETSDPDFLHALPRVRYRRLDKGSNAFSFNMDVDVDDQHGQIVASLS